MYALCRTCCTVQASAFAYYAGCKPAKKITPGGRSIGLQVRAGEAPAAKAALSSGSDKTEAVFGPLFSGKKLREAGVRELDTCSLGSQGSGASLYLDAAADFMDHDDAHSGQSLLHALPATTTSCLVQLMLWHCISFAVSLPFTSCCSAC